jgi:hypothetical protein
MSGMPKKIARAGKSRRAGECGSNGNATDGDINSVKEHAPRDMHMAITMKQILLAGALLALACGVTRAQSVGSSDVEEEGAVAGKDNLAPAPTQPAAAAAVAGTKDPCCMANVCPCPACGPDGRLWADVDFLLWWVKGDHLPPLITASPAGTPRADAGVLGTPGTTVLFGDGNVNNGVRTGVRLRAGYWCNCEQTIGIEGDFFVLENLTERFNAASDGTPILARPFFNALTNQQDSELVAFPGVVSGRASVSETSSLLGTGIWLRNNLCCDCCYRVDGTLGYRYLRMTDRLGIEENLTTAAANTAGVPAGTVLNVADRFDTTNEFNGVELGLTGEFRRSCWILDCTAKIALGENFSTLQINGATTVTTPGSAPSTGTGGLLALPSNIGTFSKDRFAVVPELSLRLGCQVTSCVRAYVGYDFLFWTNVIRPGNQIDTTVNPNLLPPPVTPLVGPSRPAVRIGDSSDIWVQGVSLGLELRF